MPDESLASVVAITDLYGEKDYGCLVISKNEIWSKSYKLTSLTSDKLIYLVDTNLLDLLDSSLFHSDMRVIFNDAKLTSSALFKDLGALVFKGSTHVVLEKNLAKEFYNKAKKESEKIGYTKDISSELVWRMLRVYEGSSKHEQYEKYIDEIQGFLNTGDRFKDRRLEIERYALPSIISLLQEGANSRGVARSLGCQIDNIISKGLSPSEKKERFVALEYQYRMHKDISRLVRDEVYEGKKLLDDDNFQEGFKNKNMGMYQSCPRSLFYNVCLDKQKYMGKKIDGRLGENINPAEVDDICSELECFIASAPKLEPYKIAIITFYNMQRVAIATRLKEMFKTTSNFNFKRGKIKVVLNTVDRFQGQEADIVYISFVRSGKSLGFLDIENRINVALSRAKHMRICFGDSKFLGGEKGTDLLRAVIKDGKK